MVKCVVPTTLADVYEMGYS